VHKTETMILFWFCFRLQVETNYLKSLLVYCKPSENTLLCRKGQHFIFLESFKIVEIAHFTSFLGNLMVTNRVIVES